MTKEQAVQFFGSQAALGDAVGRAQATISEWKQVPLDVQIKLEMLTKGRLRADLSDAARSALKRKAAA